jgi:hypothetical protein
VFLLFVVLERVGWGAGARGGGGGAAPPSQHFEKPVPTHSQLQNQSAVLSLPVNFFQGPVTTQVLHCIPGDVTRRKDLKSQCLRFALQNQAMIVTQHGILLGCDTV